MKQLLWLKFYPKDWNGDHNVRACSLAARGLLVSFLEPMHTAEPYGYLLLRGKKPEYAELAVVASCKEREVKYGIEELITKGVLSVADDGILFSRRMVRDAERRDQGRVDGVRGGNPSLKGGLTPPLTPPVNPEVKPWVGPMVSRSLESGVVLVKTEKEVERFDLAWDRMLRDYPPARVEAGRIVQDGFLEACREVGIADVFRRLDAHKRSAQWKKGLVPKMGNYFGSNKLWKQELPEHETVASLGRHAKWQSDGRGEIADV